MNRDLLLERVCITKPSEGNPTQTHPKLYKFLQKIVIIFHLSQQRLNQDPTLG